MPSFNLLTQPWIPVATGDAARPLRDVSLRDLLVHAPEWRAIDAPSPLATTALYRLTLAFLHRALAGPPDVATWERWRALGAFDTARIDAYCARWQHHFDLFDDDLPFYQSPMLSFYEKARKAATQLSFERASERNRPTLFDHSSPETRLTPAEAAIGLITTQAFVTGGLVSFDDPAHKSAKAAPLTGAGVWYVVGKTLFATLMANLVPYVASADDLPAWERHVALATTTERLPRGRCDWYTWQSRRLLLFPSPDGLVAQVAQMKGEQIPENGDPWGDDPLIMRDDDGSVLSPRGQSAAVSLGTALSSLRVLRYQGTTGDVALAVCWAVTHQVKFISWHATRIVVPGLMLRNVLDWIPLLADTVTQAQILAPLLTGAPIVTVAGTRQSPMRLFTRAFPQRVGERAAAPLRYWRDIDLRFRDWLTRITRRELTLDDAAAAWRDETHNAAFRAFQGSLAQIPNLPHNDENRERLQTEFDACLALITIDSVVTDDKIETPKGKDRR